MSATNGGEKHAGLSEHISEVPKHGRSKHSRSQKHAHERKKSANVRKRAQTQVRKRAQKGAKARKRARKRNICKQPGPKQPGLGTRKHQRMREGRQHFSFAVLSGQERCLGVQGKHPQVLHTHSRQPNTIPFQCHAPAE